MFKPFIPLAASVISMVSLAVMTPAVLADSSDFDQPIKVDAKSQFIDGKKKTSTFKDDVTITQGSLIIIANEVQVIASEGDGKEVFIAYGEPASYSQTMDDGTKVKASADEIRYEVARKLISLNGEAQIQQNTSMVQGDSITYDMGKEQLLATGGESGNSGRVTTVFRPDTVKGLTEEEEKNSDDENNEDDNQ